MEACCKLSARGAALYGDRLAAVDTNPIKDPVSVQCGWDVRRRTMFQKGMQGLWAAHAQKVEGRCKAVAAGIATALREWRRCDEAAHRSTLSSNATMHRGLESVQNCGRVCSAASCVEPEGLRQGFSTSCGGQNQAAASSPGSDLMDLFSERCADAGQCSCRTFRTDHDRLSSIWEHLARDFKGTLSRTHAMLTCDLDQVCTRSAHESTHVLLTYARFSCGPNKF